ncbi:MAG TPA: VWA domain-containing protein [Candidatus Eremiobacteraeota bacterium]|nr:MAG: von Willebrand factor type A domain protein [bacterium ADurb.Bin363]HPZ07487.1 VWA domain-containing protein [Candidatus Eremiobacteraeota bacterium]
MIRLSKRVLSLIIGILFLYIIFCSTSVDAQKIFLTQDDILTLNRIDILAYPTVFLNVIVTDKAGNPVEGLGIRDFSVSENGVQQKLDSVINSSQKDEPVLVMLTMDASGSMGSQTIIYYENGSTKTTRPMDDAKDAAKNFVSTLKSKDRVIVSGFANYWVPLNEPTEDRAVIINSIDKLEAEGGTALYQGVAESVKLLKQMEGNKAVIVLSDGNDTSGRVTLQECLTEINGSGVPVFTIGLGRDIDEKTLLDISQSTGGRYFKAPDSSKLKEIYELIAKQLQKQYWLRYKVKKSHPIGSQVNVTVSSMSPSIRGVSSLIYITPPQLIKRIIEFSIGLIAIILLTVMFFHLFWKGFGFDPVISSYISILISIFLAVGLFTFLFLGVFVYYKMTLQVFLTLGILSILAVIFVIWKIKDYA